MLKQEANAVAQTLRLKFYQVLLKHPRPMRSTVLQCIYKHLLSTYYMSDIISSTGTSAMNKAHKNACPHKDYILAILFFSKCFNLMPSII